MTRIMNTIIFPEVLCPRALPETSSNTVEKQVTIYMFQESAIA